LCSWFVMSTLNASIQFHGKPAATLPAIPPAFHFVVDPPLPAIMRTAVVRGDVSVDHDGVDVAVRDDERTVRIFAGAEAAIESVIGGFVELVRFSSFIRRKLRLTKSASSRRRSSSSIGSEFFAQQVPRLQDCALDATEDGLLFTRWLMGSARETSSSRMSRDSCEMLGDLDNGLFNAAGSHLNADPELGSGGRDETVHSLVDQHVPLPISACCLLSQISRYSAVNGAD
jgi:hypothetical protein